MSVQTRLRVVSWYFLAQLSQDEIARRLNVSRSSVSRMLAEAREGGLIDVRPRIPGSIRPGLAALLAEQHGLRDVVIVGSGPDQTTDPRDRLGLAAARYLQLVLRDGVTIGISWGTSQVVSALEPSPVPGSQVVQFAGGLNPTPGLVPLNELVQLLAAKLGATARYVYAPAIADTTAAAATFRAEPSIAHALAVASEVDVGLSGVGDLEPGSAILAALTLSEQELARLRSVGAVGTTCVRFFGAAGQVASPEIDARTVGISLDELVKIPTKIVVAGEQRKEAAVRAAIKGRLVDILITDESLALALLSGDHLEQLKHQVNGCNESLTS
jgi:deoxyribonucleoside regulator